MEKCFEVIDHTADIGIMAYGKTLADMMSAAAEGMTGLMTDISRVGNRLHKKIELQEADGETLLVAWLNELLYQFEVERLLFSSFDVKVQEGNRLTADCRGEKFDPARHRIKREIKAATYHNLKIMKERNGYTARIIFDI